MKAPSFRRLSIPISNLRRSCTILYKRIYPKTKRQPSQRPSSGKRQSRQDSRHALLHSGVYIVSSRLSHPGVDCASIGPLATGSLLSLGLLRWRIPTGTPHMYYVYGMVHRTLDPVTCISGKRYAAYSPMHHFEPCTDRPTAVQGDVEDRVATLRRGGFSFE